MKALIISDGKKGHENQSVAYCELLGVPYEIIKVQFRSKFHKALSYFFDWMGLYTKKLFLPFEEKKADIVVSAGSSTYYANKWIAKQNRAQSIALMYPKGYRKNFSKIYAQMHDEVKDPNAKQIPINFSISTRANIAPCQNGSVALIVGGSNSVYTMDVESIKPVVEYIFKHFKDRPIFLTTSPRTPKEIEKYLEEFAFTYKVIYSKNPINPIGDFLHCCERVFITIDSTSMISEAVSSGKAAIEVISLPSKKANKYEKMVQYLEKEGCLHIFDGKLGSARKKIDLRKYL
ncbi:MULTISPECIES: ELM1/GtrOC1 family putative glycosyltransferase [unclassified Nitratiruptor]|uniref:ELM1/GtrOC1 family putative glycosyltransferase n=1 Tax=unclassified Nitratiruptor TaxID=2624044 RepID=UPI001915BDB1|nr:MULTISPECIES: ELM1/GtrOC1 family putative glycosyltransferase [unclassified Nitratiruptor]BCD60745.1 hypothetical protein NitYY0810_C1523 [Nitratiruptor sp. YY08-10]BCD64677.1 hypothetical protein NitYY0814_C1531 [Nitratiruptor sp. YY08-14]